MAFKREEANDGGQMNVAWKQFKLLNYLERSACHHLGTQSDKGRYPEQTRTGTLKLVLPPSPVVDCVLPTNRFKAAGRDDIAPDPIPHPPAIGLGLLDPGCSAEAGTKGAWGRLLQLILIENQSTELPGESTSSIPNLEARLTAWPAEDPPLTLNELCPSLIPPTILQSRADLIISRPPTPTPFLLFFDETDHQDLVAKTKGPARPDGGRTSRAPTILLPRLASSTLKGLSAEEIQLLRQGQAALGGGSTSSRAASRASSQGLLLLDSSSLAALGRYFDRLMANIEQNIQYLSEQAQMFTQVQYDRAGNIIDGADAEIARYQQILVQLDELETDFDRIAHIKEIVKGYRSRVEDLERDLEASGTSSRHHKHSSHKHSHSHSHKQGSSHKSRH
ncbi:hypothetical protein MAC_06656 [Metarhizium acridum CQMa 102]|uniref:Biogenesis of lysosome-related organelles complex 1 subunit CNL1 n=1 Tax=Metarhizium acridum (strain CQMa 102) TaxID=655827 RepID=E9E9V8_METAQ|nr:uncharacterized protein MAC_06656 [Metarhizium acridum CQMa 102]EFY87309.1 hypothetical protein MAC_06656 [Metarhizium acridum CQMa 102]